MEIQFKNMGICSSDILTTTWYKPPAESAVMFLGMKSFSSFSYSQGTCVELIDRGGLVFARVTVLVLHK